MDTFETAITWDRFDAFYTGVKADVICRHRTRHRQRGAALLPLHARLPGRPGALLHPGRQWRRRWQRGQRAGRLARHQGRRQRGGDHATAAPSPTTTPSAATTAAATSARPTRCSAACSPPPSARSIRGRTQPRRAVRPAGADGGHHGGADGLTNERDFPVQSEPRAVGIAVYGNGVPGWRGQTFHQLNREGKSLGCCRFQRHLVKVVDETGGGIWQREGNSAGSSRLRQ